MSGEKQETVAGIVAEMRIMFNKSWHDVDRERARGLADRIEAAWRRERESVEAAALFVGGVVEAARHRPGNAAAMREALVMMNNLFEQGVICTSYANSAEEMEQIEELYRKARAALSAPARNCDVGTAEAQEERYKATGEVYHTLTLTNVLAWAQMQYKAQIAESIRNGCEIGVDVE